MRKTIYAKCKECGLSTQFTVRCSPGRQELGLCPGCFRKHQKLTEGRTSSSPHVPQYFVDCPGCAGKGYITVKVPLETPAALETEQCEAMTKMGSRCRHFCTWAPETPSGSKWKQYKTCETHLCEEDAREKRRLWKALWAYEDRLKKRREQRKNDRSLQ